MRAANRALAAAERRWAKARKSRPLRTSRAVYSMTGRSKVCGLGPVVGDIVEVLGVSGDLLEQTPGGFDVGQVLFALILSAAGMEQAVGAPDALQARWLRGRSNSR